MSIVTANLWQKSAISNDNTNIRSLKISISWLRCRRLLSHFSLFSHDGYLTRSLFFK
ncbi:unnamed protein product [Brugia timori]|uniref:Uncharacterized protein n=1 Tax=Brugia timori TaxID=42155 RepID=A0A0R3Q5M4_9BILA|nr:unnamed protein product [Brugia timori]